MKKVLKWAFISIFSFYIIFGYIILPYLITSQAPKIVSEQLGANLDIGSASFDPFGFELKLYDISFSSPENKPILRLKELIANYELYDIFTGVIRLKEIGLIEPKIFVLKDSKEKFNFSWLLESSKNEEKNVKQEDNKSAIPAIVMEYFHIKDASIVYTDESKKPTFSVAFDKLGFRVYDIDTKDMQHSNGAVRFFTHVNDGGFIDFNSKLVSLEPLAIKGSFDFESGKIYTGWSYLQEILNLEIADGKLYAHTDFLFNSDDINTTRLENIALKLEHLRIKPKKEHHDILHVSKIQLNDGSLYPMAQSGHFDTLEIDDIALHVKRYKDGSLSWEHYLKSSNKQSPQEPEKSANSSEASKPWDVTLDNFKLHHFKADIYDEAIKPSQHLVLNDFNLSAQNLHSLSGHYLNYQLALRFNNAMLCKSDGYVAHSYLDANGSLTCKGINLTWFNDYISDANSKNFKKFDIGLKSAKLKFNLPYSVTQNEKEIAIKLKGADIALNGVKVNQKSIDKTLMRFSSFSIDGIDVDTSKESLHVSNIILNKPRIYAKKYKDTTINFNRLVEPKDTNKSKQSVKTEKPTESKWLAKIDNMKIKRAGIFFDDASLQKTARMKINEFNLHVRDISSDMKHTFKYDSNMRINDDGKLFLRGKVTPEPLHVTSAINLKSLSLDDANPYIAETLKLYLAKGDINFKGNMNFKPDSLNPDIKVNGNFAILDFIAKESKNDKTLISFDEVRANPFYFDMKPDRLSIESLKISGLYSNIHIDSNKTLNLAKLTKESNTTVKTADTNETNSSQKKAFPVNIVKLDFKDGVTDFADDSLPLKFKTHIHDVEGSVYGISSEKELTSYVNLKGVIDKYGSMKVDGSLNSANPKEFTDLSVDFRNLALNNMSPYSATFAGRKIDEGKLSLSLQYKIIKSQILGENSIVIKKIKLGEEFEGESSLPLALAVALLEDSDGMINIDMPVEGNMDEPDFKYGALVMKTLGNLIIKIVSSPFSFLGSMLGVEGDELKFVSYEAGESILLPPEREKLDALAKALAKRPKLSLKISASQAPKEDRYALQIKKLKELVAKRTKQKDKKVVLDIKFVELVYDDFYSKDSRVKLQKELKKKYEKEVVFKKEYENTLLNAVILKQEVSEDELKALADKRAVSIKNYLNVVHKIQSDKIEISKNITVEKSEDGLINSQLDIIVKE
jgi:hypothetical protein